MNNFDKIFLEYMGSNIPAVNPEDLANKLGPALKSLPTNIAGALAGVTGAVQNATQKNPDQSALIDKLKNPDSKYSSDELTTLQNLFTTIGAIKPNQQQKPSQDKTTPNQQQQQQSPDAKNSTTYGGNLQGL
jgi:hypothetical protein